MRSSVPYEEDVMSYASTDPEEWYTATNDGKLGYSDQK
jgi:hypothetical protein